MRPLRPPVLPCLVGLGLMVFPDLVRPATSDTRENPETPAIESVDHPALIRAWNEESLARGERLYQTLCITCHGTPTQPGTLPTSRAFWKEPLKNGADPFALYRTLDQGLGQMPAWSFLAPGQRYDVIQYLRETFLKPHQPAAYVPVTDDYLASLPRGTGKPFVKTAAMLEFEKGPAYLRMDFGPALFWTLEVAPDNLAYKGIAVRLDPGPGGVSKGRAWLLYDQDTLRVAAAWTGEGFVDWKGIAFDGSHQTHTSIVGPKAFVLPVGPGWAHPDTGAWDDPRPRGRDGRPYGPLPRDWSRFEGLYRHDRGVVVAYSVGRTRVLESPGILTNATGLAFTRNFSIGPAAGELRLRLAPVGIPVRLLGNDAQLDAEAGLHVLRIPPHPADLHLGVVLGDPQSVSTAADLEALAERAPPPTSLEPLTRGAAALWNPPLATRGRPLSGEGPFAVDELTAPPAASMPWHSWMRFGGFDFFPDGRRAAIATWNGDVWIVDGIDGPLESLVWKRIVGGLFQPLGVRVVDDVIHVACRDMIARLHDLNGDDEIDWIENFNNDHQVTEHFHEFAMGLQTDREGNFYYAKSARHALPAIVPHHGTLLRVTPDGRRTDIVATGFRAANGVCVEDDGTFFVTDQEGHWTPKNRINWVRTGRFYGNFLAYHDRPSSADDAMEPPLVWITNDLDRSPGELVRVPPSRWGPLAGSLLNLSYGTGRLFLVLPERFGDQLQGGVVPLPIPELPTGVMRGRFHPRNGHLYACGLFAWAGNRTGDGGFYRIRRTEQPLRLPVGLATAVRGIQLRFSDPLDPVTARDPRNYAVRAWALRRSADYGSPHLDERPLAVRRATLSADGTSVLLDLPDLTPTRGMEVAYQLRGTDGAPVTGRLHNTIHHLPTPPNASSGP